ncbi:MAG: hypothetical protein ACI9R3_005181 [Verrucomicrobiales bacterium]|jgi:hypothetical protein
MTRLTRILVSGAFFILATSVSFSQEPDATPKRIHVFVALCDNATQAIAPVNARIGNGDDPDNNLYWGCSDGLPKYFRKRAEWKLLRKEKDITADILRRVLFRHQKTGALLVADAYRGSGMRLCLNDFLYAAAGNYIAPVQLDTSNADSPMIPFGGASDVVAFIGHNGLMEHKLDEPKVIDIKRKRDAIVLSCRSHLHFYDLLRRNGARPILTTQQLMYPGAFALHAALEGWLKNENLAQLRIRAGKAMASNQKISEKAATRIFTQLE